MMRALIYALWVAMLLPVTPVAAQDYETSIVTGGAKGTYIQFGRDIATIAAECGRTLNVHESAGSIENVLAVRDRPLTQFGIAQSDVLEYVRTFQAEDPTLARAAKGIRIVFPLYDEEIHVLARREIADLAGLAGKRVSTGVEGSGNSLTASLLLDILKIEPAERVKLSPADSLAALLDGKIDAFFYVVGVPAALFAEGNIDPQRFHLLPLKEAVLQELYTPAQIAAGTYSFQEEAVDVVAVKAVLLTYNWIPKRNDYQASSCQTVADFSYLILSRLDRLRQTGHPKWKAVDLTALPPGWTVGNCVLDGIAPGFAFSCRRPDGTVAQEGLLPSDAAEPNKIYVQRVCAKIGC
ncbi:MAG TPA: TAXI family TRAP transporter solute-binding subunit [Alphaproteobacteria bacterium]|nr:TAXI family TRAP transporter solute-binding subunit [Alphaproteobacteria bacterium]